MPSRAESLRRHVALARSVLRARRGPFDPFKLTWILGEQCSLRCRTCHLWHAPHAGPSLDQARAVIAGNPQLTWVNLSGGDFVERPDAPALVEAVVRGFPDLALLDFPTAGQDQDAVLAALQPALESDVPHVAVSVSIDGPDALHDRIRGRRGAAARARATWRALQRVRRRGFRVVVGTTLSRHNLATDVSPENVLPDVPAEALHLNLAHCSSHYYRNGDDVVPDASRALAVIDALARRRRFRLDPLALVESRYWRIARRFLLRGDPGGVCGALVASVYLAADMTVYPCSIHDRPLGRLPDLGWSLRAVGSQPVAREARTEAETHRCPGCWTPCEAFPTLLVGLGRLL